MGVEELHFAPRTDVPRKYRACRNLTLSSFGVIFLGGAILLFLMGDNHDTFALGFILVAMGIATLAMGAVYVVRDCCRQKGGWPKGLSTQRSAGEDTDGGQFLLEQVPSSASANVFPADVANGEKY